MTTDIAALRRRFAREIMARFDVRDPRVEAAFASVPREPFAGPGPWSIVEPGQGYVTTPDDDPAHLYRDRLVALDAARGINIGEPSAHATWLAALAPQPCDTVVQVGTGSGYYTALLAELVAPDGHVAGYEIDAAFAARATRNLADRPGVTVHLCSGLIGPMPDADAIYVNAAVTAPAACWLEALRPRGRLVFPLQAQGGPGGMLLVTRPAENSSAWPARFVTPAGFIPCVGGQDEDAGRQLSAAFTAGRREDVRSFRRGAAPDATCWHAGNGWWLSKEPP